MIGALFSNFAGQIDFGEFLRLCRYEKALPLEDILDYAQTKAVKSAPTEDPPDSPPNLTSRGAVLNIFSESQLNHVLQSNADALVVLEATLTWCRPCKRMDPVYAKCANHYRTAMFLKLTGNENEKTKALFKEKLKARVTPSFFFFRGCKLVGSCTGANPHRFEDNLRAHLNQNEIPEGEVLYPAQETEAAAVV